MSKKEGLRLNKYISDNANHSRREADRLIKECRVSINNKDAVIGQMVMPNDVVKVDTEIIKPTTKKVYLALYKPKGITCTTDPEDKNNIIDFINFNKRVFPVGRLDNPSEGLIFLTNDGDIVNKILRAGNNHEKEYLVTVDKEMNNPFLKQMAEGVKIGDYTTTLPCEIKREGKHVFRITLKQGLNRQIRRMCSKLGYKVTRLVRIRVMNVTIDNLNVGQFRHLSDSEVTTIKQLTADSVNTKEASEVKTAKVPKSSKQNFIANPKTNAYRKGKFKGTGNVRNRRGK